MRIKLDVMPVERKVLKRDYLALVLCIYFFFQLFAYASWTKIKHNDDGSKLLSEKKHQEEQHLAHKQEVSRLEAEVRAFEGDQRSLQFINKAMSGRQASWYTFFHNLESAATSKIWIKEINQDENGSFIIDGVAKDAFEVTRFFRNMTRDAYYSDVFLNHTHDAVLDSREIVEFQISFRAGER